MATRDDVTTDEQELAEFLQERIKPGLNRGSIPLVARSIAEELVSREQLGDGSEAAEGEVDEPEDEADDEPEDEVDDEPEDEVDDEPEDEVDDEPEDEPEDEGDQSGSPLDAFEAEMQELQAELGEEWILRFSVQGEDTWLTAEKQDGSQHVEGATAEVVLQAVELINEGGDESG